MTPDTIAHGEKIDRPGLYRMPITWYHDDCCIGPSISSTGLRQMIDCPAKYWAHSIYNPERRPRPSTEAFAIGKAAHAMILEGKLPEDEFVVSPYDEFRTNEAKDWRDARLAKGITILKARDLPMIEDMRQALAADPMVEAGLLTGLVECSLIWRDRETGVWLKSRPDVIPNGDTLSDTKFVADSSPKAISRDLSKYRYHMQFGLGVDGMHRVLGRTIENCAIVACEKAWPHVVTVAPINDATMGWAMRLNRLAINAFDDRMKLGDWPGYAEGPATVGLPDYEIKRLEGMGAVIPEVEDEEELETEDA